MITPTLTDETVTQNYITKFLEAFKDYVSGATNPPTCGARTCTSNHTNVPWDNTNKRFEIKTLGAADVAGTSTA